MGKLLGSVLMFMVMAAPAQAQTWVERPNADDFAQHYPDWALSFGVEGRTVLHCEVRMDGFLTNCVVEEETPAGWGFGAAGLRLTEKFRAAPTTADGQQIRGASVRIPIRFVLADY